MNIPVLADAKEAICCQSDEGDSNWISVDVNPPCSIQSPNPRHSHSDPGIKCSAIVVDEYPRIRDNLW